MPRDGDLTTNEREFVFQALIEGVRLDCRSLEDFRDVEITFGAEFGVVNVQLGKTSVFSRISAEVTQPFPDRRSEGIFTITTELSPIGYPGFETGRQADLESLLSRFLEKAIRRTNALDTESLCIISGEKCWNVRADVHVLDYDGGLVDASCIAVVAALQHFRRPDIRVEGENVKVYGTSERVPVPLSLLHHPYCVSLSLFDQGTKVIVDATLREQQISTGEIVVTANRHGEICQVAKLGGVPTDAVLLLQCIEVAAKTVSEISKKVSNALERDSRQRSLGGLISELSAENER